MSPAVRRWLSSTLRLLLAACCIVLVFSRLEWRDVLRHAHGAHVPWLAAAAVAILCEPICVAAKWHLLLVRHGIAVAYQAVLRAVFTSNFLAVMVPSSAGADALRIALLRRGGGTVSDLAGTLLADRIVALLSLVLLSLGGLPLARRAIPDPHVSMAVMLACVAMLLGAALLLSPLATAVVGWLERAAAGRRPFLQRLAGFVSRVHAVIQATAQQPALLGRIAAWNFGVQFLRIAQVAFLFAALGATPSPVHLIVFVPMIVVLTLLPLTPYGIGVKEGAFAYFFSSIGIPAGCSVAVSILTYPLILFALLPGAVFWLCGNRLGPAAPRPASNLRSP